MFFPVFWYCFPCLLVLVPSCRLHTHFLKGLFPLVVFAKESKKWRRASIKHKKENTTCFHELWPLLGVSSTPFHWRPSSLLAMGTFRCALWRWQELIASPHPLAFPLDRDGQKSFISCTMPDNLHVARKYYEFLELAFNLPWHTVLGQKLLLIALLHLLQCSDKATT